MNLDKETIGVISGTIVVVSVIPYLYRIYEGKICPNVTSWGLWSIIGLTLLLTYKSSGADANIWPALFGFTNPIAITLLAIIKKGEKAKLDKLEWWCVAICLVSLGLWLLLRHDRSLSQYALYLAIVADAVAAIPTIRFVTKHPDQDRPFAWGMFGIAYGLALFAIPERTIAQIALPTYMVLGSGYITLQLIKFRVKSKIPLTEWV